MKFRDVCGSLQMLRNFLLGRKRVLHNRFAPLLSPRSIPPPNIPRGPEYKYSEQYYFKRSAYESVLPPVVAPVAEGPSTMQDPTKKIKPGGMPPNCVCFNVAPTPGPPWWWDGHCYYECIPNRAPPCPTPPPCPPCPPVQPPKPSTLGPTSLEEPCVQPKDCTPPCPPPCPRAPDAGPRH